MGLAVCLKLMAYGTEDVHSALKYSGNKTFRELSWAVVKQISAFQILSSKFKPQYQYNIF